MNAKRNCGDDRRTARFSPGVRTQRMTDVRRRERRLPGHVAPGEETRKREKTHKKDAKRRIVKASV